VSSQDKDGPQDATEDAATEGRSPDRPDASQDMATDASTDIEDAEIVGSIDDGAPGTDSDPDAVDGLGDDAETAAEDDEATVAAADDEASDRDEIAQDADDTEKDRSGLAAAALSGAAAGAALGASGGDDADRAPSRPTGAPAPTPQKSGGGFVPAFLGGVIAAVLGIGGLIYFGGDLIGGGTTVERALATQDDRLAALDAKLDELSDAVTAPVDTGTGDEIAALGDRLAEQLAGVSDRIDTLAGRVEDVQGGLSGLDTRLADVDNRLGAVENRPLTESSEAAQAAFSAYEDDLADLQEALDAQVAANEELIAQLQEREAAAQAEVEAAAARAAELQAQAEEQARIATEQAEARARASEVREALASLGAAIERGTPFAAPLDVLSEGVDVPAALSDAAASGVASLPDLRAQFPDLARAALDASIRETVQDDLTERAVAFLKAQTGFRSLAPREGDDPDAVLSRAEAALRDGDLAGAISELNQLPPAGQDIMSDWVSRAEQRRSVTEAADTLAESLLAN
jgi:hypothetical protein